MSFVCVASPSVSSGIRASVNTPTMARNDDEQPNLSARVDTFEGRLNTLESIMDVVVQELKISLKLDDRNLADGTQRSGLDRPANNPPPPSLPS